MSTCYCTLCAGGISSSTGSIRTRSQPNVTSAPSYSVWGSLFSVLGVVVSPSLNSSLFSLCASCSSGLKELVGLKAQLTKLEEDCARKSAALRSLVANSAAWQHCFNPTTIQLRAEVLSQGGYPYQSSGDIEQQQQNNFQSFLLQAEEQDLQPHPILLPSPPLCSTLYNQDSQISVDLNQGQNFIPVGASPPHVQEYHQPVNNADPDFEPNSNSHDLDADSSSSSEAEDESPSLQEDKEKDDSGPPPLKIRKKQGKHGKWSEEKRLAMLEKRSKTEVEKFSPVVTTEDGKKFYDNFEILTLPTGTMQCVTCGWKEGNDGTKNWLRIRSMKVHIKGIHQEAYKCSTGCAINFTSLKQLQNHDCGWKNRKRGKRHPFKCLGCQKLFSFRQNFTSHKKICGDGIPDKPSYQHHRVPCPICGRPASSLYLTTHLWTHMNEEEKAEATASGQVPYKVIKNKQQYQCPTCGKMISQAHFKNHLDLHKDVEEHEKRVICEVDGCGASFLNKKFLANHKTLKHAKKRIPVACPYPSCKGKTFACRRFLTDHTRRRHWEFAGISKIFTCSICNAERYNLKDFSGHARNHEKLGQTAEMFTVACTVDGCSQKMLSFSSLPRHLAWKHPEIKKKQPIITNSKKRERRNVKLQSNGEKHDKMKKMRQSKKTIADLKRKLKKTKAKSKRVKEKLPEFVKLEEGLEWKLEFLGFTVFKNTNGYTCEDCGLEFPLNLDPLRDYDDNETEAEWNEIARQIKVHIKGIHREDYTCNWCGRVLLSQGFLIGHHRRQHSEKIPIPCSICERTLLPSEMDIHRWTHRGIEDIISALNSGEKLPIVNLPNVPHPVHAVPTTINWSDIETLIKCDHCAMEKEPGNFKNPALLYKHLVKNHPEIYVDKIPNPKPKRVRRKAARKMEAEINLNNLRQLIESDVEVKDEDEIKV